MCIGEVLGLCPSNRVCSLDTQVTMMILNVILTPILISDMSTPKVGNWKGKESENSAHEHNREMNERFSAKSPKVLILL